MGHVSRTLSPTPPRERSHGPAGAVRPLHDVHDFEPDSIEPRPESYADPVSLDDVGPSMDESIPDRSREFDPYSFTDFRRRYQSSLTPERFLRQPEHGPPPWVEQDLAAEEAEVVIPRKRVSERAPIEVDEAHDRRSVRLAVAVAAAVVAVVLAATMWMLTL